VRNGHTLIVGRSGSGKTSLARALIDRTARAIVLDREHEYDVPAAIITYDYAEAAAAICSRRWQPFVVIYRPELEGDYLRLLRLAEHVQAVEPHGPLAIYLEEASCYSHTHDVADVVRGIYNRGRHRRISIVSTVQVDTDVHRVMRRNSAYTVTLAQNQLTTELGSKFRPADVQRLVPLESENRPIAEPVQGRHFLVYPAGVSLYDRWEELHGYICTPARRQA
jgi:hypothetical protein